MPAMSRWLIAAVLLSASFSPLPPVPVTPSPAATDVPVAAQAAISIALGRDDASYHAVATDRYWEMWNAGQKLNARFDSQQAVVNVGGVSWALQLRGYGRGDDIARVAAVEPTAVDNRVEYRRDGLTEWYVNGPAGLEQGFTIDRRVSGADDQLLRFELALGDGFQAVLDGDRQGMTISDSQSTTSLRYGGLFAHDAAGRSLAAVMSIHESTITLSVDDRDATYPIVVDPFVQEAVLVPSNSQADDGFGSILAMSGDTLVVGSSPTNGAWVFIRSNDQWVEQAHLSPTKTAAGFGRSVAISGDSIAVGANARAFVFVRANGSWSEQLELIAPTTSPMFGAAVAIEGDTLVVGDPTHEILAARTGAAYVYQRAGISWNQQAILIGEGGNFGADIAISGPTMVVGAPYFDAVFIGDRMGAAYVFKRANNAWAQQARLVAGDGSLDDRFGEQVAIDFKTIVVGAPGHDVGWREDQGALYVFTPVVTGWNQQAQLTLSDGLPGDSFGSSLAIKGDIIAAGSPTAHNNYGLARAFRRTGITWLEQPSLGVSNAGDLFGASVAVGDGIISVGVPTLYGMTRPGAVKTFAFVPPLAPTANAGADQVLLGCAGCLSTVILDGSASSAADGSQLQFIWTAGGNPIAVTNDPSRMAAVALGLGLHTIQLTVVSQAGGVAADTVTVDIRDVTTAIGVPGPAGPTGATGATGPQGAQGEIGPQGPMGPQGPQGEPGPAGATGATGPAGAQGPAGPQGEIGPQGPAGPQGPQGERGPQGDTGPAGATGAQGEIGPQGPAGPQGPQGERGPQGETGPAGATGAPGAAGAPGAQGEIGPQGPMGATGPMGPQGPRGETGPVGPAGATGATGAVGPAGPTMPGAAVLQPLPGPNSPTPPAPGGYALIGVFKLEKPTGDSSWFAVYVKTAS